MIFGIQQGIYSSVIIWSVYGQGHMAQVKMDPLTIEEIIRYFKALDGTNNEMYNCLINVLYCTGMRLSEVHALQVRNISFQTQEIHIKNTKRDKSRDVFLDDNTATILSYYIKYNQGAIERREKAFDRAVAKKKKVFDAMDTSELLSLLGKKPDCKAKKAELVRLLLRAEIRKLRAPIWNVSYRQIHRIVSDIGRRAGIEKSVHPHCLRYNFAQRLHDDGNADILEVQSLMGHASISTSRAYIYSNKQREWTAFNRAFNRK